MLAQLGHSTGRGCSVVGALLQTSVPRCCPFAARSAFAGYAAGLLATIVVMNVFKASTRCSWSSSSTAVAWCEFAALCACARPGSAAVQLLPACAEDSAHPASPACRLPSRRCCTLCLACWARPLLMPVSGYAAQCCMWGWAPPHMCILELPAEHLSHSSTLLPTPQHTPTPLPIVTQWCAARRAPCSTGTRRSTTSSRRGPRRRRRMRRPQAVWRARRSREERRRRQVPGTAQLCHPGAACTCTASMHLLLCPSSAVVCNFTCEPRVPMESTEGLQG